MTDLKRHSCGYWRSIYIFGDYENAVQANIRNILVPELEARNLVYSYCFYSVTKTEAAHITFRVNFPTIELMKEVLDFIQAKGWEFEDHNYDEEPSVKLAYVVGSKMAAEVIKTIQENGEDVVFNSKFMQLMFHGFFNDMHYSYREETSIYLSLFKNMLARIYGIAEIS